MERTRRTLSVVAAAGMLALAACNGDPEATPPPTTSSPPPPTPSASTPSTPPKPTPPAIPPAATNGLTVTSAEAFARFYIAALDYLRATGDASVMRRWAFSSCESCKAYSTTYEESYEAGGSVAGNLGTKITRVTEARLVGKDTAVVVIRATIGKTSWRRKAGEAPKTFPGGPIVWDTTLAASAGHWTMFEMELKQ
ncbi:MAG TPA: DUF6318 family protein [Kribbellaceae bacterium]|nr:DUF6318 family protein [Kribbellaceae bacterium]